MSAHRVITLTCDHPGCRERWIGGEGRSPSQVRAAAKKLAGWRTYREAADMLVVRRDRCRWHA